MPGEITVARLKLTLPQRIPMPRAQRSGVLSPKEDAPDSTNLFHASPPRYGFCHDAIPDHKISSTLVEQRSHMLRAACVFAIFIACPLFGAAIGSSSTTSLPKLTGPIPVSADSYPFMAANRLL